MAENRLILAHDIGTTGNKATLFRSDGTVVASTFASYPTSYPHPNWAEQDPSHWRKALFDSTRQLLSESGNASEEIAVVSFSGHMNGALIVDSSGTPLRPAIIWADQRATNEAALIAETCGTDEVYKLTGNRVSAAYTAAKWLWIKEHEPDLYRRSHQLLQVKDYGVFLFTGEFATDYSDASLTLLLDLAKLQWAGGLLERMALDIDKLPALYSSATVIGGVTAEVARETGLRPGTPVVIGGGDGACATIGAGAVTDGDLYNYIGSSSWIALSTSQPVLDAHQRTFNISHPDPNLTIALGTMQTAGGAYDWLERLFRTESQSQPQYEVLNDLANLAPPGSHNLLFLPYLMGERSPHWNPLARGAYVGLTMSHGRAELTRAVLEGIAFNLRHILSILVAQGMETDAGMRLIGGGGKSSLWRQILADVYRLPIARLGLSVESTSLGAAIAGGIGVGLYPDYSIARALVPVIDYDYPNPVTSKRYDPYYSLFQQAYTALEPIFEQLARLDTDY